MIFVILEVLRYLILAAVLHYLMVYLKHVWSLKDYLAGPFPLPVIGNIHLLNVQKLFKTFTDLGKIYGDVYSLSFGMERCVIVNTLEPLRGAMIEKAGDFAGRPTDNFIMNTLSRNSASMASCDYGSDWHRRKMLASKALKIYSNKNSTLEEKITLEAKKHNERLALFL